MVKKINDKDMNENPLICWLSRIELTRLNSLLNTMDIT